MRRRDPAVATNRLANTRATRHRGGPALDPAVPWARAVPPAEPELADLPPQPPAEHLGVWGVDDRSVSRRQTLVFVHQPAGAGAAGDRAYGRHGLTAGNRGS